MKKILVFVILSGILISSCKKTGCVDYNAANWEGDANCIYSSYVLYCPDSVQNNINIFPLIVSVDGQPVGTITRAAIDTPQNCSSALPDTVFITGALTNAQNHTWIATSKNNPGITFSGNIVSVSHQQCEVIKIH